MVYNTSIETAEGLSMKESQKSFTFNTKNFQPQRIKKVIFKQEEESSSSHKIKMTLLSSLMAIAGLVGIYYNVDYSGWLIFFAFIIL